MGVNDSVGVTQEGDHGAEILAHFSTVQLGASCQVDSKFLLGLDPTVLSGDAALPHTDAKVVTLAHFPSSDLRGGDTFLIYTKAICWPRLAPKGRHPPSARRAAASFQGEEAVGLVLLGQVTYEHDRGLPEGGPGTLGVLQALAEEREGTVSMGVHLDKEKPESAGPSEGLPIHPSQR